MAVAFLVKQVYIHENRLFIWRACVTVYDKHRRLRLYSEIRRGLTCLYLLFTRDTGSAFCKWSHLV